MLIRLITSIATSLPGMVHQGEYRPCDPRGINRSDPRGIGSPRSSPGHPARHGIIARSSDRWQSPGWGRITTPGCSPDSRSRRDTLRRPLRDGRWPRRPGRMDDCRACDLRKRPGTDRSRLARPPQGAPSWSRGPLGPRRHRYAPTAHDATRAIPDALQIGGRDEVGEGEKIHQRKKPPPSRHGALVRWPRVRPWRVEGTLEGVWRRLRGSWTWERAINNPNPKPPLPSGQDRSASFHDRGARRTGDNPARRASSGRAPSPCLRGIGPAARGPKARGLWLSPCARSRSLRRRSPAGSSSSRSARSWPPGGPADDAPSASPTSAPGSPAARWSPGAAPSTTARAPAYGLAELSRLTGVSPRRARASVKRLVAAGLLTWSDDDIGFPDAGRPRTTTPWPTPSAAGSGALAIPRRILRLLAGGARPALIATAIAVLLRCLARGRGGFKSRGRVKAAWIARTFDVDLRRVKQARGELVDLGWIVPEPDDQWAMNRWGRAYRIDLDWGPDRPPRGSAIATPSPPRRPPIATP